MDIAGGPRWEMGYVRPQFSAQGLGVEKAQCTDHLDVSGARDFLLPDQEKLIEANVLGAELIGWFAEVPSDTPQPCSSCRRHSSMLHIGPLVILRIEAISARKHQ
jgi:hypothetical protein